MIITKNKKKPNDAKIENMKKKKKNFADETFYHK